MSDDNEKVSVFGETVVSQRPGVVVTTGGHRGRVLAGKYRLVRPLGAGGMGEVYRAEHVALGTALAVKTMHAHIAANPDLARRFGREALAASRLNHPNVVKVLDFGEDEGLYYIVMELLLGESLGARLGRLSSPPSLAEAADVLEQVLEALKVAHAAGIVHRDLKPENIFLTSAPSGTIVKVLDFGLAHVEDAHDSGPTLTKTDTMGGTPEYMSPEQCRSLAVGPSADLYSLGCVMTTLLSLKPPFTGEAVVDIISKHMFLPPPPLIRPEGGEAVPPLLERLRRELLAKSPEKRPANAEEAIERLKEAMSPEATLARLPERKGEQPLGARGDRLPDWPAGGAESSPASAGSARGREARVGDESERARGAGDAGARGESRGAKEAQSIALLRLTGESGGVSTECITGLAAQGFHVNVINSLDELTREGAAKMSVVLVDAGDDMDQVCALVRKLDAPPLSMRTLVCAKVAGVDKITALIAAGAGDVATYPIGPDSLAKKLVRMLRRRRHL